uniref:Ecto-NOX disulfide-thiol exchanger 2-like n=1 Tax=Sinocyclocheilus rhinocerous TaxID=307959 RepID=A0A673FVZ2_9TELE
NGLLHFRSWDYRLYSSHSQEIRNIHNEELMGIRREEEMEMSDDDMEDQTERSRPLAQVEALKEENDSLRCQLDAYRNEVELLKQEQGKAQPQRSEEDATRQQQLSFLQQALQGMQKQLLKLREDLKQRETELEKNSEEKQQLESQIQSLKDRIQAFPTSHALPVSYRRLSFFIFGFSSTGIISTFLHVHPFGASIEYICSYLQRLDTKISTTEVETLLGRLPCTFKQELTGVGASLEKRWKFCGFEGIKMA